MFNFRLFALPLICESEFGAHEAGIESISCTAKACSPRLATVPCGVRPRQSRVVVSRLVVLFGRHGGFAHRVVPQTNKERSVGATGCPSRSCSSSLGPLPYCRCSLEPKAASLGRVSVGGPTHMASVGGQRSHENDAKKMLS